MPKLKLPELEGDHPDHQAQQRRRRRASRSVLAVNGDKADAVRQRFYASRVAADLQNVAFVEHDVVSSMGISIWLRITVEAAVVGQPSCAETAAHGVMVFTRSLR